MRIRLNIVRGRGMSVTCLSVAIIAVTSLSVAAAPVPRCEGSSEFSLPCFDLRGRLQLYNRNPAARIWPVGSNRLLGIDEPGEEPNVPDNVRQWLTFDPVTVIYANFRVCPHAEDVKGAMRYICVEKAWNMRVERYDSATNEWKIISPRVEPQPSNQPLHPTPLAAEPPRRG